VTLKQIARSQPIFHEGCPVQVVDECPPLAYSGRVDQELVQELQEIWVCLEEKARGASGELSCIADNGACAVGSELVTSDNGGGGAKDEFTAGTE
jgi:hypothetical protein